MNIHCAGPVALTTLDALDADTLLVFVAEDERPLLGLAGLVDWRLAGALSRYLAKSWFTGALEECSLAPGSGRLSAKRVVSIGLGPSVAITVETLQQCGALATKVLAAAQADRVALGLPGLCPVSEAEAASALGAGLAESWTESLTLIGSAEASSVLAGAS